MSRLLQSVDSMGTYFFLSGIHFFFTRPHNMRDVFPSEKARSEWSSKPSLFINPEVVSPKLHRLRLPQNEPGRVRRGRVSLHLSGIEQWHLSLRLHPRLVRPLLPRQRRVPGIHEPLFPRLHQHRRELFLRLQPWLHAGPRWIHVSRSLDKRGLCVYLSWDNE